MIEKFPPPRWLARIEVMLKTSIFDAQGETVKKAVQGLLSPGFGVENCRMGKLIKLQFTGPLDQAAAELEAERLCKDFFCNEVIEAFEFSVVLLAVTPEIKTEYRGVLDRHVEELELDTRQHARLRQIQVNTICDLIAKREEELLFPRQFGRKSLDSLIEKLAGLGLHLGMSEAEIEEYRQNTRG